ncbi:MAG: penicillin-insensitive murein endopeptidase [Alphaproteobacteria bacterium]|nr:penicillin-insensitive murein endopeptidase [Alphaproteobacteria bacterium]
MRWSGLVYGLVCIFVVSIAQAALAQTTAVAPPPPEKGPASDERPVDVAKIPAKKLFGAESRAAKLAPRAIGFYSRGCLSGGEYLPPDGPAWQAMRLSRNRNWAHPDLVDLVKRLATESKAAGEWPGLLVGDLTQPRGGPMTSGHASHQVGLDADVWLTPMPERRFSWEDREKVSAVSMLKNSLDVNPEAFTPGVVAIIKRAASYPEVERIGVNPAIKYGLCKAAGGDTPWLAKIQGWGGHTYHMHIRIKCPPGSNGCRSQGEPTGTSCAVAERWYADTKAWLENPKKAPKGPKTKRKPKPPMTLEDLPDACRDVLAAAPTGGPKLLAETIVPPEQKPSGLVPAVAAAAPIPIGEPAGPGVFAAPHQLQPSAEAALAVPQPKPAEHLRRAQQ